jgi:hypothetical protein
VWKQIFGVLTIALLATGCGSSGGRELSAAEPPADAAAQASQLKPATDQPKNATRIGEAVSRPAARTTSPTGLHAKRSGTGGACRRTSGTDCGGACLPEFTLPVGTTLPVEPTTTVRRTSVKWKTRSVRRCATR